MGLLKSHQILGFKLGEEIVCLGCALEKEMDDARLDQVVIKGQTQGDLWFCDRCQEQL